MLSLGSNAARCGVGAGRLDYNTAIGVEGVIAIAKHLNESKLQDLRQVHASMMLQLVLATSVHVRFSASHGAVVVSLCQSQGSPRQQRRRNRDRKCPPGQQPPFTVVRRGPPPLTAFLTFVSRQR